MANSDVSTLFRRFGGNASVYQEIISREQVVQAEEKWPILGNIKPSTPHDAPSANRAALTHVRHIQEEDVSSSSKVSPSISPVPPLMPEIPSIPVVSKKEPPQGQQGLKTSKQFFQQPFPPEARTSAGGMAANVANAKREESSVAQAPLPDGLFADFLSPHSGGRQKLLSTSPNGTNGTNGGFLGGQAKFAHMTPNGQHTATQKVQEPSTDMALGRKLGGHFKITATHETKSNFGAVLSRTQQTVNKGSSELQQIFGKMVSQADTPVPISKEGTIKRPIKW